MSQGLLRFVSVRALGEGTICPLQVTESSMEACDKYLCKAGNSVKLSFHAELGCNKTVLLISEAEMKIRTSLMHLSNGLY